MKLLLLFVLSAAAQSSFESLLRLPARELLPALASVSAASEEDALLARLSDPDPVVRAMAAKALKPYAPRSYEVERRLLELVESRSESEETRVQSALSLARTTRTGRSKRPLLAVAVDASQASAVRGAAFKALWQVVHEDLEVRRAMISCLGDAAAPLAARQGAAWALFADNGGYDSQQALLAAASDAGAPEPLRLEAVKSLYGEAADASVRRGLQALAEDASAPESVRAAAALCHHRLGGRDYGVVRWLKELSESGAPASVRAAAALALQSTLTLDLARYFHLAYFRNRHLDPLE